MSGLTSLTICCKTIGQQAVGGLSALTEIVLGEGVERIDDNAIVGGCNNLKDIYCNTTSVPEIAEHSFDYNLFENCTLHVPSALLDAYKADANWNQFQKIVTQP